MVAATFTCRDDEQLGSTRYETANWTKNDVLCSVVTLRLTIEKATQFTAHGREVIALMCKGRSDIVALPGHAWKLTSLCVEPQASQGPRVGALIIETADGCDGPLTALIPNGALCREAIVANAMLRI